VGLYIRSSFQSIKAARVCIAFFFLFFSLCSFFFRIGLKHKERGEVVMIRFVLIEG